MVLLYISVACKRTGILTANESWTLFDGLEVCLSWCRYIDYRGFWCMNNQSSYVVLVPLYALRIGYYGGRHDRAASICATTAREPAGRCQYLVWLVPAVILWFFCSHGSVAFSTRANPKTQRHIVLSGRARDEILSSPFDDWWWSPQLW